MHRELPVELAAAPEAVFPWLLEPDRVPRWSRGVESYEVVGGGPIGPGTRIRQTLEVSGKRRAVVMEVTRYEPPSAADTRFELEGIEVVTAYRVAPDGAGSRLTQTLDAKARGFTAKLLLPIVEPHLERKLVGDLQRLRELVAAA